MKIKNLAFYGVMAAILGSVGTARADDSTIIASKGYVDAYAQKQADRVQQVYSTYTADANNTEAKKKADYPSMYTLEQAINGVDLSSTLNGLDLTDPAVDGKPIVSVSQAGGQVSAAVGDITTAGIRSSALATSGTGNNNLGTAGSAVDTKLPTEKAVADALALKEDVSNKQAAQDLSAAGATLTRWNASTASDTSYPTVKAVAQQIADVAANQAQSNWNETDTTSPAFILNKPTYEENNVVTSTNPDKATKVTAVQKGTLYMNGANIANRTANVDVNAVGDYVRAAYAQGGTPMKWGLEGIVGGTEAGHMDDYVPTVAAVEARIRDQNRYNDDFYVQRNGAINASGTNNHSIVTYDEKGLVKSGIALPGLNDINASSGGSSGCDADNPCVLSFYVDNGNMYYKWTKMDIVDLDVTNDTTPAATTGA